MFGFEKERRLAILNEMMWGSETMPYEDNLTSYARYQEKLNLYGRDLSEARSGSEKEAILEKNPPERHAEELQQPRRYQAHAAYSAGFLMNTRREKTSVIHE